MAQCITCGTQLHPERARKYNYCMARECQEKNAKGLTMVAVGVNKSAEQYLILDDRTRDELASGKYHDQRRGSFGTSVPSADRSSAEAGSREAGSREAGSAGAGPAAARAGEGPTGATPAEPGSAAAPTGDGPAGTGSTRAAPDGPESARPDGPEGARADGPATGTPVAGPAQGIRPESPATGTSPAGAAHRTPPAGAAHRTPPAGAAHRTRRAGAAAWAGSAEVAGSRAPKPGWRKASRSGARRPWSESQERLALLYNEQGIRPNEIAQKIGLSTYAVTQIILSSRNRGKL